MTIPISFNLIEIIYFIVAMVLLVVQGVAIGLTNVKGKTNNTAWNIFLGMVITAFAVDIIIYAILANSEAMWGFLGATLICILPLMAHAAMASTSIILTLVKKNPKIKINWISAITALVATVVCAAIILVPHFLNGRLKEIEEEKKNTQISNNVIEYLKDQYGETKFEIKNIEEKYGYNGFQKFNTGYRVEVIIPVSGKKITVELDKNYEVIQNNL